MDIHLNYIQKNYTMGFERKVFMKTVNRTLTIMLALIMMLSLTACSGEKQTETKQTETQGTEKAKGSEEEDPVTIQFMHGMIEEERQEVIQGLIDKFTEENPWITVEQIPTDDGSTYDTKLTAFAGGDMPAVIEVNQNRAKWLAGNELSDLDAIREVIETKSDDYYDAILKINTSEDGQKYIGIPVGGWVQGIWYNKTAFEEKGLAAPDTWDNIIAAAKAFYDPDNKKYGIALPTVDSSFSEQSFSQFALSNGANVLDADGNANFNSMKMIEALTYYQELYQYSIQGSNGTTEVKDAMLNGTVPMGIYSTYILQDLINAGLMDDFGFTLVKKELSASYGSIGMLAISADLDEEEREAAILFTSFLIKEKNNIEWLHMSPGGQQPVMASVASNPEYLDNEIIKGFETLAPEISAAFENISLFGIVDGKNYVSMGNITSSNIISKAIYDITVNEKNPAEVANSIQNQIEALLAQ